MTSTISGRCAWPRHLRAGLDAQCFGLVAGRDAAGGVGLGGDNGERAAAIFRVQLLLHRGEEAVEVDVEEAEASGWGVSAMRPPSPSIIFAFLCSCHMKNNPEGGPWLKAAHCREFRIFCRAIETSLASGAYCRMHAAEQPRRLPVSNQATGSSSSQAVTRCPRISPICPPRVATFFCWPE